MATNFPEDLDSLINPQSTDSVQTVSHSAQHADSNDAIEALQAKVGVDDSTVITSLDYRVGALEDDKETFASDVNETLTAGSGINKFYADAPLNFKGEYNLQSIINEIDTNWIESEWGFPKGRHNYQEKDLLCAFREFEEETGYSRTALKIIQNIYPFEEIFTGSNYKSYKHKYFLANIDKTAELSGMYNKSEVSKLEWKKFDEVIKSIRPYNLEKLDLITLVHKVLTTNKLYENF